MNEQQFSNDEIVYEGGVHECTQGAYNLYVKNGRRGYIVAVGIDAYYIPPDANPNDPSQNLGDIMDEGKVIGHIHKPLTVEEVSRRGLDITIDMCLHYDQKDN